MTRPLSWLGRRSRVRVGWWLGGCWESGLGLGCVVRWGCGGVSGGVLRNVLCRNGYVRTLVCHSNSVAVQQVSECD